MKIFFTFGIMKTFQLPFYARLPLILLAVLLIYVMLNSASGIFIPLTFSLFLAILLFPFTRFLEQKLHFGKSLAALVSVLVFLLLLGCFVYFFTLQFISFSQDLPMLKQRFEVIFTDLQQWLSFKFHITTRVQTDYLNKSASSIVESAAYSLRNVFFSVTTILLWTIFIFLFTFFMLFHRRLLNKFMLHLFSVKHREKVSEIIMETKGMINGYILALLIEMVLVSTINCTMFLIMGIKYAMFLGIMAGVLNIIPYLGIYTSILISMLVTFANSTGNMALEVAIGLFSVHLIDSNVLMPRLVGGRVKMNPFITILAVMVGEFIWGVPGMFLFIPITGIIKLICERVEGLEAWGILIGVEEKEIPVAVIKKYIPEVPKEE